MLASILKSILTYCSYLCIITTPLAISFIAGKCKRSKTGTKEERAIYNIKKWDPFERYLLIFIIISGILGPLYAPIAIFHAGTTQIGSIIEKREYTENYYVYMRKSETSEKNYKLKARIRKDINYMDDGDTSRKFEGYYIEELYFQNGKHITFLESDQETNVLEELEPYTEVSVMAQNGQEYFITLTREKFREHQNKE